jgi:predicted RNA-binding protein with PUA-like domain
MPYLLKSEPDMYSYDDLLRDGETDWDGIKNYQALNYLAAMKKGEKLVIYHSNVGKDVVGPLAALREAPVFHGSIMFTQFRLSVVPLTDEQYDWLVHG